MKCAFKILLSSAALLVGCAFSSGAMAACTSAKNADGSTGTGTWPSHQWTQQCGTATYGYDMYSAFGPWSQNDAVAKFQHQLPIFYLFVNETAQKASASPTPKDPAIDPSVPGFFQAFGDTPRDQKPLVPLGSH